MKWLVGLGLAVLLSFFMRDMVRPGLPKLHDSNPHISRAIAYHTALLDGQWPPMWAKEVLGGIGSPVLMLNYQLPYLLSEVWHRAGFTYFDSYKLTLIISFIASGLVMYLALAAKFGNLSAWIGALIYTLAPYRFVDIYVRGALGESLTFIFPPLLIWGFAKSSMPILILGWTGLFLTHPLASAAFSAFFLGYTLWIGKREERGKRLKLFFGSFGIALLLSSFNLLPTLALTKYTYYSPELSDTLLMFPTLSQLWHSAWGYGVSLPGPNDGMSFEVGIMQWGVMLAGFITMVRSKSRELRYLFLASIVALFFMLPISLPIYKLFHLAAVIDFPWRLLFCLVFSAAWMGALVSNKILDARLQWGVALLLAAGLIAQSLPIAHTDTYWDKPVTWFARETGDSYGEYAPLTRETRDSAPFWKRAEFVSGEGEIATQIERSNHQKYLVKSDQGGIVRINTAYFPGWMIPANCYVTKRILTHIDDSGLIGCTIPPGESSLEIKFVPPAVQRIGNMLTLLGIGVYLWILLASFYRHITKRKQ